VVGRIPAGIDWAFKDLAHCIHILLLPDGVQSRIDSVQKLFDAQKASSELGF